MEGNIYRNTNARNTQVMGQEKHKSHGNAYKKLLYFQIIVALKTTEMLMGNDEYCTNYLKDVRAGQIVS